MDAIALMAQYTGPGRLHSAYSFSLMGPDGSATRVRQVMARLRETIEPPAQPCYAFSNHDKPRVTTRWLQGREPEATAKQMLALLASMPGHICVFQGEELGLPQAEVPFERLQDPYGKAFWPRFKGRDGCRTPMPWNAGPFGGFSEVEPWLPVPDAHIVLNIERQESVAESPLHAARNLLRLRRSEPALAEGALITVDEADDVLWFVREAAGRAVRCIYNLGNQARTVQLVRPGRTLSSQLAEQSGSGLRLGVNGYCWLEESVSAKSSAEAIMSE